MRKDGQFLVEDFFINSGGLNTADSPFLVEPNQAAGGQNFDYVRKGGFRKRPGHTRLNSTPNAQLRTLGLTVWDKPATTREVVRAAGTKLQVFDQNTFAYTNLTEDTLAAGSDFFSTTTYVVSSMFNTPDTGVSWHIGGGSEDVWGVYSGTKVTKNGVEATGGTATAVVSSSSGGTWTTVGAYRYAFALYKASTASIGNAGTEATVTVATLTDTVTITLSSLSAIDTTKYTKLYIYRSAVSGVAGFTTGDLVKTLDISAGVPATTTDLGTSLASAQNVPRSTSLVLDNSPLPVETEWSALTTWKRRLVVASASTIRLSDLNKSESWPTLNTITIPSGGPITGMAVIGLNSGYGDTVDEVLCIFKQRELWVVTGSSLADWELKFIDNSGCPAQPLLVPANGYLAWVTYRGAYLWDGTGKPSYLSQAIEDKFQRGGDIDKSKLTQGFGIFAQDRNEIQWYLSSAEHGTQKYALKLDLRLTLANQESTLTASRQIHGKFTPDVLLFPCYAGVSFLSSATASEESIYLGDDGGYTYSAYSNTSDAGTDYTISYITPYLHLNTPGQAKRIHKLVLWVKDTGSFNIDLDFWGDYRYSDGEASARSVPVSPISESLGLIWDVGLWDVNLWDEASQRVRSLVYNFSSTTKNNNEGDAFRFRISQTGSAETVLIYGFSLYFTELGLRK